MYIDIKDKLKQKGISRYELAKRIDVTYPTITSIYNGNSTSIKLDILEALCRELECTPNDILFSGTPPLSQISIEQNSIQSFSEKILTLMDGCNMAQDIRNGKLRTKDDE